MIKQLAKVPVTARALLQRVNRKLAPSQQILKAAMGRERDSLGDYYVVDIKSSGVRESGVDLAALARRLGVMREWETLR